MKLGLDGTKLFFCECQTPFDKIKNATVNTLHVPACLRHTKFFKCDEHEHRDIFPSQSRRKSKSTVHNFPAGTVDVPDAGRNELRKRRLREIYVGGLATHTLVLDWYFDRFSLIGDLDALEAKWVLIWVRRRE